MLQIPASGKNLLRKLILEVPYIGNLSNKKLSSWGSFYDITLKVQERLDIGHLGHQHCRSFTMFLYVHPLLGYTIYSYDHYQWCYGECKKWSLTLMVELTYEQNFKLVIYIFISLIIPPASHTFGHRHSQVIDLLYRGNAFLRKKFGTYNE